jgi:hypothetical protein
MTTAEDAQRILKRTDTLMTKNMKFILPMLLFALAFLSYSMPTTTAHFSSEQYCEQLNLCIAASSDSLVNFGESYAVLKAIVASKSATTILKNRAVGNAFRDEVADLFSKNGYETATEVYKKTPFRKRFIDVEVSRAGKVLGGIETKSGGERYNARQRAKDFWLQITGTLCRS